jgi:hypothetical protein
MNFSKRDAASLTLPVCARRFFALFNSLDLELTLPAEPGLAILGAFLIFA